MARTRMIKPGFFLNEDLAALSTHARLLFIGLWMLADREGRLEDRPQTIKAQILPFEDVDIDALLTEIAEAKTFGGNPFIMRYQAQGLRVIWITRFATHQNAHKREVCSVLPAPPSQPITNTIDIDRHDLGPTQARPRLAHTDTDTDTDTYTREVNTAPSAAVICPDFPHYDQIKKALIKAHPNAAKRIDKAKACAVLDKLVRLDGYKADYVRDVLVWLFRDEDLSYGDFTWRQQVQGLSERSLRHKCKNEATKFDNIAQKYEQVKASKPKITYTDFELKTAGVKDIPKWRAENE